jgi:hypothetical protein
MSGQFASQPSLSDSGFSRNQKETGVAIGRAVKRGREFRQFPPAPHEIGSARRVSRYVQFPHFPRRFRGSFLEVN